MSTECPVHGRGWIYPTGDPCSCTFAAAGGADSRCRETDVHGARCIREDDHGVLGGHRFDTPLYMVTNGDRVVGVYTSLADAGAAAARLDTDPNVWAVRLAAHGKKAGGR